MKATKLPSGNYRVKLYIGKDDNGKKIFKSFTGATAKEAQQMALEYDIDNKKFTAGTFGELVEYKLKINKDIYSPSTTRKYKSIKKKIDEISPLFSIKPIHKITDADVQEIVSRMIDDGLAPKTITDYVVYIKSILRKYIALDVDVPKIVKNPIVPPTEDEIKAILDACNDDLTELFISLGSYCMMREGEICALTNEDYNPSTKQLHINKTYVLNEDHHWEIKPTTKTCLNRVIKIPDTIADKIKDDSLSFYKPLAMYTRYKKICDSLGYDYRFHDLRHFGASYFHALGIPMSYTQSYGGWESARTLLEIYQHPLREQEDKYMNILNNGIAGVETRGNTTRN